MCSVLVLPLYQCQALPVESMKSPSSATSKSGVTYRNGAGGIVLNPEGKMILVLQRNGVWSFPKGKVEENEERLAAARREIFEETGIRDLTYRSILGSYTRYAIDDTGAEDKKHLKRITLFLFSSNETYLHPLDTRIRKARWVSVDEALELLAAPKDQEFLESIRKRL